MIGCHYNQNKQRDAPCYILNLSVNDLLSCIISKIWGTEQPYWQFRQASSRIWISLLLLLHWQHLVSWWRDTRQCQKRIAMPQRTSRAEIDHLGLAHSKPQSQVAKSALTPDTVLNLLPIKKSIHDKPVSFYRWMEPLEQIMIQKLDSNLVCQQWI